MRELTRPDLRHAFGAGLYTDYGAQEICPIGTMMGYWLGSAIQSWSKTDHRMSVNGVITAISLCARRIDVAREVTFHYLPHTRSFNAITHLCCGIVMGMTDRPRDKPHPI
ncbi:hypothetical protein [Bordetella sp. 15P40C-2]|uniref:hypothetical protein n=1 Tax=Bordetella sp. 15P40C-2 TaxID=2572246 RepID=UPI00132B5945|nr:hypothetical protein [Bordetella sp. 15P40C-2]MVW72577.1 hypothetical protein [Bordetella sp. 15P40C-2]